MAKKKKKKSGRKSLRPIKPRGWSADDHFDPKKVVQKICNYLKKAKSLYDINERLEAVHWGGIKDLTYNGTGMLFKGTRFSKSKRKKLMKKRAKKKSMKRSKKRVRKNPVRELEPGDSVKVDAPNTTWHQRSGKILSISARGYCKVKIHGGHIAWYDMSELKKKKKTSKKKKKKTSKKSNQKKSMKRRRKKKAKKRRKTRRRR